MGNFYKWLLEATDIIKPDEYQGILNPSQFGTTTGRRVNAEKLPRGMHNVHRNKVYNFPVTFEVEEIGYNRYSIQNDYINLQVEAHYTEEPGIPTFYVALDAENYHPDYDVNASKQLEAMTEVAPLIVNKTKKILTRLLKIELENREYYRDNIYKPKKKTKTNNINSFSFEIIARGKDWVDSGCFEELSDFMPEMARIVDPKYKPIGPKRFEGGVNNKVCKQIFADGAGVVSLKISQDVLKELNHHLINFKNIKDQYLASINSYIETNKKRPSAGFYTGLKATHPFWPAIQIFESIIQYIEDSTLHPETIKDRIKDLLYEKPWIDQLDDILKYKFQPIKINFQKQTDYDIFSSFPTSPTLIKQASDVARDFARILFSLEKMFT